MKNKDKVFLSIIDIIVLILVIYPIFKGGLVGGYDPGFHMGRIHTLASNISHGHFPNPIGFEYLNKFGYGVGFFYGNFFIYPFAILMALGMSSYHAYALLIITFVALSIVSINFTVHQLFHKTWATMFSAPIYLSSYYLYGIIYTRAAAGELMALALIPLVILSAFKLIQNETKYWWVLAVSLGMLFVSHVLSFLITTGAVLLIFLMNIIPIFKKKKMLLSFIKSGLLFLGLTSVFSFSFVQQYLAQKYINTSTDGNGNYSIITNSELMRNHIFDTQQFVSLNGTFLVILLLLALVYYLYKGRGFHFPSKAISQSYIIILLYSSLTLSTALLKIAVKLFKPLILLQVISRVNMVMLPLLTIVVAYALGQLVSNWGKFKIPFTSVFLLVIIVITVLFPIKSNMEFIANRKGPIYDLSVSMGEYEPADFMNYNLAHQMKVNNKFLEKNQKYEIVTNNNHKLVVRLDNNQSSKTIMLPRIYYKGYQVSIDSNGKTLTTPASVKNGLVTTKLPDNFRSGKVTVTYKTTGIAKIGWLVTIITLIISIWLIFKSHRKNKKETAIFV